MSKRTVTTVPPVGPNDLMAQWLQELRIAARRDRVDGTKNLMESELEHIKATDPMVSGIIMEVNAMLINMGQVITQEQAAGLLATMGVLFSRSKKLD